ncbi:MAG: restriction endonuclease [Candidatus Nanohalobium sp.]
MTEDKEDIYRLVDRYLWENYPFSDKRAFFQKPLAYLFNGSKASEKWSKEDVEKLSEELQDKYSEGEYWLCRVFEGSLQINAILLVSRGEIRLLGINSEDKSLHSTAEVPYEGLEVRKRGNNLFVENGLEGERKEIELLLRDSDEVNEAKDKILEFIQEMDLEEIQGRWISKENVKEYQQALKSINEGFRHFTPTEFEYFIGYLFQEKGFDVEVTQQSNDYGVDVIAEDEESKIAIQVKRKKPGNKVGSKTVRESLGSLHKYNADEALIVTSSSFTNPAIEQGKDSPIKLWDRSILKDEIEKVIL